MSIDSIVAHSDDQDKRYRGLDPEGNPIPEHPKTLERQQMKSTDNQIHMRTTPELRQELADLAQSKGLSIAACVRMLLLEKLEADKKTTGTTN